MIYASFYVIFFIIIGPYGEQDDEQVFVQKVMPETSELFVRLASNGKRYNIFKLCVTTQ